MLELCSREHLKAQVDALPADPEQALEQLAASSFFSQLTTLSALEQNLVLQRLKKRTSISVAEARRCLTTERSADATRLRDIVLAYWVEKDLHLRYVAAWQEWFVYESGVYKKTLGEAMLKRIATLLENKSYTPSERTLHDVLAKLSRAEGIFLEQPPSSLPLLNVRNGLVDLETLELKPHTPEVVTFAQAPTAFELDATAPHFQAFLERTVPNETHRQTLQEFMGYALTPHTFLQRALYLKGPGGTGKGTLLSVMQHLLSGGEHGLSTNLDIEELNDGSPSLVNAVGKRLIYISEVPARANLIGFKKVVGEDRVLVNPKYKRPFDIRLEAKLVISANDFIHTGGDSANNSIDRRLILLPFEVRPKEAEVNPTLLKDLTTPEELSGILLWALTGWAMLQANNYRFSSYGDETQRLEFLSNSNPVLLFLQERCRVDKTGEARSMELFEAWRIWCEGEDVETATGKHNLYGQEKTRWQRRGGSGHRVGSIIGFSKRLEEAVRVLEWPAQKVRKEKGSTWLGIAVDFSPSALQN